MLHILRHYRHLTLIKTQQILITPQAKPMAVAALIALVNLCVEVDFWIEHRMILGDRRRTSEMVADILAYALKRKYLLTQP